MRIQGKLGVACEIYNILQKEELTMQQKAAVSTTFCSTSFSSYLLSLFLFIFLLVYPILVV